jgi:uncharacterized protein
VSQISTHEALRALYRMPSERVLRKELTALDDHCRGFIAQSPFVVLATVGGGGQVDVSPRGDTPGFVQVDDRGAVLIPDRPGNNRLDSLTNLVERPEAATIFMIPGVDETLRINGTIAIRDDPALRERFVVDGRLPTTVLVMEPQQVYLHCAKAFMRARLWDPVTWPAERPVPTLGAMIKDQIPSDDPAETQEQMLARYRETLY